MHCYWSFVTFVTDLRLSRLHKKIQHFPSVQSSSLRLKFKARTLAGVGGREAGSSVSYEFWISGSFRFGQSRPDTLETGCRLHFDQTEYFYRSGMVCY